MPGVEGPGPRRHPRLLSWLRWVRGLQGRGPLLRFLKGESFMTDEMKQVDGEATERASDTQELSETEHRRLWREGLIQEALDNRPELRAALGGRLDFAASRAKGYDLGFEDAARLLTPQQLQGIQALKDRRISRYVREELPRDLQATLARQALGMDEGGYLLGYVDGVTDFLSSLRRRLHEPA